MLLYIKKLLKFLLKNKIHWSKAFFIFFSLGFNKKLSWLYPHKIDKKIERINECIEHK